MAFIRKRANGMLSLTFFWKGKRCIKALGSTSENEAKKVKKDVEDQLARIRRGQSPKATRLLAQGIPIVDVIFGSPEVTTLLASTTDDNPLTLADLADGFLDHLKTTGGHDQQSNSKLWLHRVRDYFKDDKRVMTLTPDELSQYSKKREKSVGSTSIKKELTCLKAAITWAVNNRHLPSTPINRWPTIKTQRQKRFEWKSDIDEMIASQKFTKRAEREAFLKEMKMRMVLTKADNRAACATTPQRA